MKKQWIKTDQNRYAFMDNGRELGSIKVDFSTMNHKAEVLVGQESFVIKRKGFWKSSIEITDHNDIVIAQVSPEKWYSSAFILDYKGGRYKLICHNNPLVEWVILDGQYPVMAYGLDAATSNKQISITETSAQTDVLLHCLLCYIMVPVMIEEGDDLLLLVS
jgi:hypothetical protein